MEVATKELIRLKLATAFRLILKKKKKTALKNKQNNIENLGLVSSMRQLEADSGLSFTIIQRLFSAKRDIQFTSLIALLESLDITLSEFGKLYDKLNDAQIKEEKTEINKKKILKKK